MEEKEQLINTRIRQWIDLYGINATNATDTDSSVLRLVTTKAFKEAERVAKNEY
jgi:hypothetical protein